MKIKPIWIAVGGVIILAALFLFRNFHLSFSNTFVNRNSVTTSMGNDQPEAILLRGNIMVIVEGEGGMVNALQKAVRTQISASGISNPVITEAVEPGNTNPVLLIKIASRKVFWTPFFGSSSVNIMAGYVSNGDISLIQELPLKATNADGTNILMSGDYKLTDRSFGFISLPGYRQSLAKALAGSIMEDLKAIYKVSP
jgi:hypothetical protein